jgi:hypothetical protein
VDAAGCDKMKDNRISTERVKALDDDVWGRTSGDSG